MKKIFLSILSICSITQLNAQGNFKITGGLHLKTSSVVYLVLDDVHFMNHGTLQQARSNGIIKFVGNADVNLSGSGITTIDRLMLAKGSTSKLNLNTNIMIVSEVIFQSGLLNLDNWSINLGSTGVLTNESENSRAYTIDNGTIVALRPLNNPNSVNIGNLGAVISSPKNLGTTWVYRGHKVQQNVNGSNNSIMRYYDILPANNIALKATLRFHYFDAELNGIDEATLAQWKKKAPIVWDYVGADSKDPVANYVQRNNISKFTRWTLAMDVIAPAVRVSTITEAEIYKNGFTINVMPNPTINSFIITIKSEDESEKITMRVIDISGKVVELKSNIIPDQIFTIGTNYIPGVYLLEAIQGKNRKVTKLVKQ